MNVDNILKVADAIENQTIKHVSFDMREVSDFNACGSRACIAGYALAIERGEFIGISQFSPSYNLEVREAAREAGAYLGLSDTEYNPLFFPDSFGGPDGTGWFDGYFSLGPIRKEQAVKVLRHLASTGEVDWTVGAPE